MSQFTHEIQEQVARVKWAQDYPYLQQLERGDWNGLVVAAKNIRQELKRAFPGVKFRVKTSRFAGGDSIDVRWTDGPNSKQVEEIVDKYKAGSYNGMDDIYEYSHDGWASVYGDAKYVSTHRDYSDELIESAIVAVSVRYQADPITVEQYRRGESWKWLSRGGVQMDDAIRQHLYKLSRTGVKQ
jgi:hypothetical protein